MKRRKINLFIVDDDEATALLVKQYLNNRFGPGLNISTFYSGEECLDHVDEYTDIVILDYFMKDQSGIEVLESIKIMNPKTEVIMFSNNEDIGAAIESFKKGAKDYIVKDELSLRKMTLSIAGIISKPIQFLVKEFGISRYTA